MTLPNDALRAADWYGWMHHPMWIVLGLWPAPLGANCVMTLAACDAVAEEAERDPIGHNRRAVEQVQRALDSLGSAADALEKAARFDLLTPEERNAVEAYRSQITVRRGNPRGITYSLLLIIDRLAPKPEAP